MDTFARAVVNASGGLLPRGPLYPPYYVAQGRAPAAAEPYTGAFFRRFSLRFAGRRRMSPFAEVTQASSGRGGVPYARGEGATSNISRDLLLHKNNPPVATISTPSSVVPNVAGLGYWRSARLHLGRQQRELDTLDHSVTRGGDSGGGDVGADAATRERAQQQLVRPQATPTPPQRR